MERYPLLDIFVKNLIYATLIKESELEKAQKAIDEVAAAKGVLYVLDASVGKGLLVKKGQDIFNAVKAKLGF